MWYGFLCHSKTFWIPPLSFIPAGYVFFGKIDKGSTGSPFEYSMLFAILSAIDTRETVVVANGAAPGENAYDPEAAPLSSQMLNVIIVAGLLTCANPNA